MANVTQARNGEFLGGVLRILTKEPQGLQAKNVLERMVNVVPPNEYEQSFYGEGALKARRYEKLIRFATVHAVKAGWLQKNKGVWTITSEGKAALEKHVDPASLYRAATRLYNEWSKSQPEPDEPENAAVVEPDEKDAAQAFEEAEEQAWAEVQQYIQGVNPYAFQDMVAGLLKAMGYHVAWVSPTGKDGGVDIIAWSDPLGTRPPRIKVQVKRRKDPMNVENLRAFMSLLGGDDVGLFVSSGGFTKDAHELARSQESRKITLIDLERFFDLWVEFYGKLEEPARQQFPLRAIWFLAPET